MSETHSVENIANSPQINNLTSRNTHQEPAKANNETDIPISVLEEIIEGGEDTVINPQLDSSIDETNVNNGSSTSFSLPSEFLQSFDSVFSLGSQEFSLNSCAKKRLVVGLTSSGIPNLKVIFKLHDLEHNYCLTFSKKEWNKIVQHEMLILESMNNNFEEEICDSSHMRIETLVLYNRPCVKFCDDADNFCTLALETFQHMMLLKNEIEDTYKSLNNNIKDVTKRIQLFIDVTFFLLFKSNNIDNRHNYNRLMLFMNKSSNFLELSSSVADTWKELGDWLANESNPSFHH